MRLAIVSDIHANLEALRATLESVSADGVDRLLCLGDIVGYHADPEECVALLRRFDPVCVAGNHDRAVAGCITTEGFSADAARGVAWTRERLSAGAMRFLAGLPREALVGGAVVAVHGALLPEGGCEMTRLDTCERRRRAFEALAAHPSGARVCAFGHTHRLGIHELRGGVVRSRAEDEVALRDDALYLINPGTVGQPRTDERRATYIVLDTARRMATIRRVEYDIAPALEKARKAGLLPLPSSPVRAAAGRALRRLGLYDPVKRLLRSARRGAS
ncbi:MAG: metallophosphoesterase family protein [Acetobacteraceae bacterium]|nr:metallophosphoesterase family protein [Acetobacteraceae bacterium]